MNTLLFFWNLKGLIMGLILLSLPMILLIKIISDKLPGVERSLKRIFKNDGLENEDRWRPGLK
jgi:hypothetical protein